MGLYNLSRTLILFLIDIILLKKNLEISFLADKLHRENNYFDNCTFSQIETGESAQYYKTIFLSFIKIIVFCLIFCSLLCYLFVLPARYLYQVYFRVVSVCIGAISYWLTIQTLKDIYSKYDNFKIHVLKKNIAWDVDRFLCSFTELQAEDSLYFVFFNLMLQFGLSLVFDFLLDSTTNKRIYKVFSFSFIIPTLVAFLPSTWTCRFLNTVTVISTLLPLFIMMMNDLLTIKNLIHNKYTYIRETIIIHYRINTLLDFVAIVFEILVEEWDHLEMSSVLRMFWAIRVLIQIPYLITDMEIQNETLFGVVKNLLVEGCDTFTAVLGMTSYISYLCRCIEAFFQWVLLTDNIVDTRIEINFALSFFMLAVQSEQTCSDPEERFITLYNNVSFICFSLLNYIHTYVLNPLLISLNTSSNSSLNRHIRALLVCGFFIVCPITICAYLWSHHSGNTWLLAIFLLNITIVLKVGSSLFKYCLLLIDAYYTFWEELDDYVYYIESFSITVEFCYNIFLFLNGAYAIAFVPRGAFLTIIKCINVSLHAYSFIWRKAKNGWNVFIKRRTAMNKVKSLSDATIVELAELDDICAICYGNMASAKITRCNHYFHGVCLLRTLLQINDQDRCPLCQSKMFKAEM